MKAELKAHPASGLFPLLDGAEYEALKAHMEKHGQLVPIILLDGQILDGRNRYRVCREIGADPVTVDFSLDGSTAEDVAEGLNLVRRHLDAKARAAIAVELRKRGDSYRAIGKKLGVSKDTAQRDVETAPVSNETPAPVTGLDGKSYPASRPAAMPHVAQNAGDNEWYTPKPYIAAATAVLGHIDIDPASSVEANKVVKAEQIYTAEDNGLKHNWAGKLWMNPPYASELVGKFIEKLTVAVESGKVPEALVLVNNATETKWFARLAGVSTFLCFPTGRVKFWHPRKESMPLQGQCVAYIGKHGRSFCKEFREFGIVVEIIR